MKKLFTTSLLALLLVFQAAATNPPSRHEVRLGWGDMLFETMAFHNGSIPSDEYIRKHDHKFTGHIFAEYRYHLTRVVSLGFQMDFEGIFWKETPMDIYRKPTGASTQSNNYNLTFMPTVQFTYFQSDWVRMYGGVGLGLLYAFNNAGQHRFAPAFSLSPYAIQVGKGHWCGTFELGSLTAMNNLNEIYMAFSRLVSISVNYRW